MIKVEEKHIEDMVKTGLSDVNYRSLLLYSNNAHSQYNSELTYDLLASVSNITIVIYIFDLDAYIIDNPYSIANSCMSNITVITKQCSNSYDVTKEKSIYGLCNIYSILTRTFKLVYNAATSTVYIEGNKSSKYHFFQRIERWTGKASMRIYSTSRYYKHRTKSKFVNKDMPPAVPIPVNTEPMYKTIRLRQRVIEDRSYGLELMEKILSSDKFTAASLYTKTPVYRTGISVKDLSNIDTYILENKKIGTLVDRAYDNQIKSYSCRYLSYGTLIVLKDALIGLFVNSNSKTPFQCIGQSRECIFVYMNHYCYYIGRTYATSYTFTDMRVTITEGTGTSSLDIDVGTMEYTVYGDFRKTCKKPLIPADAEEGFCRQYLYKDIHDNLNLVYKSW